jgi:hypothetical protein
MAAVAVTSVRVLDNPAPFTNPLQFEIQYECMYHLKHGQCVGGEVGGVWGAARRGIAGPARAARAPSAPVPPARPRAMSIDAADRSRAGAEAAPAPEGAAAARARTKSPRRRPRLRTPRHARPTHPTNPLISLHQIWSGS